MSVFVPEFSRLSKCALERLDRALRYELEKEMSMEKATYAVRQGMIAEGMKQMGPLRTRNGIGELIASVDEKTYYRWLQQEGPQIWHDKNFMKKFLKDNPECKAPRPVMKPTILVS